MENGCEMKSRWGEGRIFYSGDNMANLLGRCFIGYSFCLRISTSTSTFITVYKGCKNKTISQFPCFCQFLLPFIAEILEKKNAILYSISEFLII